MRIDDVTPAGDRYSFLPSIRRNIWELPSRPLPDGCWRASGQTLGVTLLERQTQPLTLTAAGHRVL